MTTQTEPTCATCRHSRSEPAGEHHKLLRCSRYIYQSCRIERTEHGKCGPEGAHYEPRTPDKLMTLREELEELREIAEEGDDLETRLEAAIGCDRLENEIFPEERALAGQDV